MHGVERHATFGEILQFQQLIGPDFIPTGFKNRIWGFPDCADRCHADGLLGTLYGSVSLARQVTASTSMICQRFLVAFE